MKIAVLFAGMPRNYDKCCQSILDFFTIEGVEVDFFIHAWNNIRYKNDCSSWDTKYDYDKDVLEKSLNNIYKPKKIVVEDQLKNQEIKHALQTIKCVHSFCPDVCGRWERRIDRCDVLDTPFYLGQIYSIDKVSNLRSEYEKENDFKYDVVFKFRLDEMIAPQSGNSKKEMCQKIYDKRDNRNWLWGGWVTMEGPPGGGITKFDDQFFGSVSGVFDIFNGIFKFAVRRSLRYLMGDHKHSDFVSTAIIGDLILKERVFACGDIGSDHILYRHYHRDLEDQSFENIRRVRDKMEKRKI